MSEPLTEPASVEAPAAPPDAPQSPSEAINLAEWYSENAQQIADGQSAQPEGDPAAPFSDEYLDGYEAALLEAGFDEPAEEFVGDYEAAAAEPWQPQPGEAAFEPWALAEIDRVHDASLQLINEAAQRLGVDPTQLAQAAGDFVGRQEAEARAEARQYREQANEFAASHIEEVATDWGAGEYVDPAAAMSLARYAYGDIAEHFGPEAAAAHVEEIYDGAVRAAAAQFEEVANHGLKVAQEYAPNAKDPVEALRIAEEIYPRRLRELGDPEAAFDAAFKDAARTVGGEPTTPRQIRNLYAQKAQDIEARQAMAPPAPEPPPRSTKQIVDHYAAEARRLAKETR